MYPQPSFNPEQFTACYRAYTAALLVIQSETRVPPGNSTCLTVALRIIEASASGERDVSSLKQIALHDLVQWQNTVVSSLAAQSECAQIHWAERAGAGRDRSRSARTMGTRPVAGVYSTETLIGLNLIAFEQARTSCSDTPGLAGGCVGSSSGGLDVFWKLLLRPFLVAALDGGQCRSFGILGTSAHREAMFETISAKLRV